MTEETVLYDRGNPCSTRLCAGLKAFKSFKNLKSFKGDFEKSEKREWFLLVFWGAIETFIHSQKATVNTANFLAQNPSSSSVTQSPL